MGGRTRPGADHAMTKWVYDFAEGSSHMRELLGGKGANLAEMTRVLGPESVPAGFTITTETSAAYMRAGRTEPDGMLAQVAEALGRLEQRAGKRLGDPEDPLLVSVRSGARESLPGMLDTVLNLGLNDASVGGLASASGDPRFAWDSYRRFVQMFGNISHGIPAERFEDVIQRLKRARGAKLDTDLDVTALRELTARFRQLYDFPSDPQEQLRLAIRAVFESWNGARAVAYRRIHHIPHEWGTAVTVQQMVFGNKCDRSAAGVAFSRDEITGAREPSGDFLVNAQGEDVVSGMRNTRDLAELAEVMPEAHTQLMRILRTLEAHFKDMQDTEFTVEDGHLYLLQTRNAKRPAQAAVRFACDAFDEGLLTRDEALQTIESGGLDALLHPTFDPQARFEVLARGIAASPGAAKGEVVFTAAEAITAAAAGRDVILVRPFTQADDVAGFHAARGILTSEGGKASHAALVARGMGRPAVVGAGALKIDLQDRALRVEGYRLVAGDQIAIDGSTGIITVDDVPLVPATMDPCFERVLGWADEVRRLRVRANADDRESAAKARELGAEGIGLCRTEHMFMAADRHPIMRAMIMADDTESRRAALAELLPLQQEDFEGLFEAMAGLPVTVRLLDPPLHEFLPDLPDLCVAVERARVDRNEDLERLEKLLRRVREIHEENPMLGTRGCRLGILHPEIYEMQVEAIMRAVNAMLEPVFPEIMIPLVGYEREMELMRELVLRIGECHGLREGSDFRVGATIELPRACFVAGGIAEHADFLSFGTNDLTQTALGFSRDDAEAKFARLYIERRIIERSPFETIDEMGVGELVRVAVRMGRDRKPSLTFGVCGEHGGDPDSIAFFHAAGLDYVSCSPYRVPIARMAAAQAALRTAG
jgi:pyruvate,orthophosphate dikinase